MLFNVPQYIDVEDKIAGPFTAKQLLWMFGMGAVLLVLWNTLEKTAFFIAAVPVALIFTALAFYRPYNQPLIKFIISGIFFLFSPKIYTWKRMPKKMTPSRSDRETGPDLAKKATENKLSLSDIESLSRVLDTKGAERNEKIMEIIKRNQKIKN